MTAFSPTLWASACRRPYGTGSDLPADDESEAKAAPFTADGKGETHAIHSLHSRTTRDDLYEVMDRFEIKLSDAFQVNVLTAKGK